jgi:hypothetical protein
MFLRKVSEVLFVVLLLRVGEENACRTHPGILDTDVSRDRKLAKGIAARFGKPRLCGTSFS